MAKTIEEALSKKIRSMDKTATEKFESFLRGKNTDYMEGYDAGKSDQRKIDIEKLKAILNSLMVDTRCKAAIISLMEDKQ